MPAKSRSQQRLFSMALAVRKGKLKRTEVYKSVLEIVDSDMTNKEIEDFTKIKEKYQMKDLKELLIEANKRNLDASVDKQIAVIENKLTEAFLYIWDQMGIEITSSEYNELVTDVLKHYDIKKQVSWGNNIKK